MNKKILLTILAFTSIIFTNSCGKDKKQANNKTVKSQFTKHKKQNDFDKTVNSQKGNVYTYECDNGLYSVHQEKQKQTKPASTVTSAKPMVYVASRWADVYENVQKEGKKVRIIKPGLVRIKSFDNEEAVTKWFAIKACTKS